MGGCVVTSRVTVVGSRCNMATRTALVAQRVNMSFKLTFAMSSLGYPQRQHGYNTTNVQLQVMQTCSTREVWCLQVRVWCWCWGPVGHLCYTLLMGNMVVGRSVC
jgi:hypothetical protein